jgi:hypothetical protein
MFFLLVKILDLAEELGYLKINLLYLTFDLLYSFCFFVAVLDN